ncbi:MAG TPA: hypothetical protein VF188_07030 [Longimicrobiales bacterium]
MFTRCIYCHAAFRPNETLEHLRPGRRVAFDPARGRLWVICEACRRWTLEPIEERWEALEELERLTTDRARLLSRTDNIALLRVEDLTVVRVGRAELNEEAWWRYGRVLTERHRRNQWIIGGAAVVTIGIGLGSAIATGGGAFGVFNLVTLAPEVARRWKFRSKAWVGRAPCPRCGGILREVTFSKIDRLILTPQEDGIGLRVRCYRCGPRHPDAGYRIDDADAGRLLRRILAYQNFQGAPRKRVTEAVRLVEEAGTPAALTGRIASERPVLSRLDPTRRIALEIALNDEVEQRLLELELEELEARWREAEQVAAIADGELTPMPLLDTLRRRLRRGREPGAHAPEGRGP